MYVSLGEGCKLRAICEDVYKQRRSEDSQLLLLRRRLLLHMLRHDLFELRASVLLLVRGTKPDNVVPSQNHRLRQWNVLGSSNNSMRQLISGLPPWLLAG